MQMIQRNVPYGSDCWITETGFLVGPAYQREVRPDNQDHMAAEGLTYQIQKRCESMHKNTLVISISKFKWNTARRKKDWLIKYFTSKIRRGVSIMTPAASAEELQLVLVGKCSETFADCLQPLSSEQKLSCFFCPDILIPSYEPWLDAVYHNRLDTAIACLPADKWGPRGVAHFWDALSLQMSNWQLCINPLTMLSNSPWLPLDEQRTPSRAWMPVLYELQRDI